MNYYDEKRGYSYIYEAVSPDEDALFAQTDNDYTVGRQPNPEQDLQDFVGDTDTELHDTLKKITNDVDRAKLSHARTQDQGKGKGLSIFSIRVYETLIIDAYELKQPLFVYGDPGLGKTQITLSVAQKLSQSSLVPPRPNGNPRRFVNWLKMSEEQKEAIVEHPENFFIFMVQNTAHMEPVDWVGFPANLDVEGKKSFIRKPDSWIIAFADKNAAGLLFLDEFNLGRPEVQNSMFSILDSSRRIGQYPISKHLGITAAGNLEDESSGSISAMSAPIINRFTAGMLIVDPKDWLDWAVENDLDHHIIEFVKTNPESNFYIKPVAEQVVGFPTPRSMESLSEFIKLKVHQAATLKRAGKKQIEPIELIIERGAQQRCGPKWASEFMEFVKATKAFRWTDLAANPSAVSKWAPKDIPKLLIYMYGQTKYIADNPKDPAVIEQVLVPYIDILIDGILAADDEWGVWLFKGMSKRNPTLMQKFFSILADYNPKNLDPTMTGDPDDTKVTKTSAQSKSTVEKRIKQKAKLVEKLKTIVPYLK